MHNRVLRHSGDLKSIIILIKVLLNYLLLLRIVVM
uniref:Uncharacterized protein n=1 Tax=Myoviridae sp. ct9dX1 TaxID=2827665 RepID=A0A8S5TJA7_9CAUD|nr:MAG TPA: hypothetical protein [Myoviridae sp. ct9dX1]